MKIGFVKAWYRCVRYPCCDFAYDPERGVLPPKRGKKDEKEDNKKDDKGNTIM